MSNSLESSFHQISNFGNYFIESYDKMESIRLKNKNVIICGMGGSAIAGNYLESLAILNYSKNQVLVWRNYEIPSFLNENWIAVVISYSGNTEETVSMLYKLQKTKVEIFVITSGGLLEKNAINNKNHMIKLPVGYPPRFALPLILGITYKLLESVLNLDSVKDELRNNILNFESLTEISQLQEISSSIMDRTPIIISEHNFAPLSLRFRCQINENSKLMAYNFVFPEFGHNAIVGFEKLKHPKYCLILISGSSTPNNRIKIQSSFVEAYVKRKDIVVHSIKSKYNDNLSQLLDITRRLDYVSYNIALLSKIDPISVESINELKQKLNNN